MLLFWFREASQKLSKFWEESQNQKKVYAENLSCLSHWEPRKLPRPPQLWARWSNPFTCPNITYSFYFLTNYFENKQGQIKPKSGATMRQQKGLLRCLSHFSEAQTRSTTVPPLENISAIFSVKFGIKGF